MKPTEQIKVLRQIVDDWDTNPLLDEAQERLFGQLARGLAEYDYEKRHGRVPPERVCLLCGKLWSECYC